MKTFDSRRFDCSNYSNTLYTMSPLFHQPKCVFTIFVMSRCNVDFITTTLLKVSFCHINVWSSHWHVLDLSALQKPISQNAILREIASLWWHHTWVTSVSIFINFIWYFFNLLGRTSRAYKERTLMIQADLSSPSSRTLVHPHINIFTLWSQMRRYADSARSIQTIHDIQDWTDSPH